MIGLTSARACSHAGSALLTGKNAPERNISGASSSCTRGMTVWIWSTRTAITRPSAVMAKATTNSSPTVPSIINGS